MYLALSLVLGLVQRYLNPPLWVVTLIFVPAAFALSWVGTMTSNWLVLDHKTWGVLIILYCGVASIVPVWALLQPRGYLGGFILYSALALGIIGVFFGGYEIRQPAFKGFDIGGMTGMLFPFLFVTIACGACSGFHGLVCSGTTSKQVDRESHIRPVGYGGMLAEGFVAMIALVTVMIVGQEALRGKARERFTAMALDSFSLSSLARTSWHSRSLSARWPSPHLCLTLWMCAHVWVVISCRSSFGWKGRLGALVGTLMTMALPFYFIVFAPPNSWSKFWTLFGASNQLLAALTLLSITVWLYQARRRIAFTLLPMIFVLVITLWALVSLVIGNLRVTKIGSGQLDIELINAIAAAALVMLALYLAVIALVKLRGDRQTGTLVTAHSATSLE